MDNKVKDGSYINIQAFMVKDLKLSGNDLLVYAIIFGFSQDGESRFQGSLQYLADWTASSKRGVQKNLANLCDKQLIVKYTKTINNVVFNEYEINWQKIYASKFTGMEQSSTPMEQSSPNNINNNIEKENNCFTITKEKSEKTTKINGFVPPTVEEVSSYCKLKGYGVDAEIFVDYYNGNGWRTSGKPMKSWKSTVATWEGNGRTRKKEQEQPKKIVRDYDERSYSKSDFERVLTNIDNLSLDDM